MPEFGFPAQPRQAGLASLLSGLRARSDDARVAAITGRPADVTRELGGRVGELMQIEKSIADLRTYAESISLAETRAAAMQRSLDALQDSGRAVADTADMLLTNGTDANFEVLSGRAREELGTMVGALNLELGGRALFAGDEAGGAAIAEAEAIFAAAAPLLEGAVGPYAAYSDLQNAFMNAGGLFESSFYLGGDGDAPLTEVAPGERVAYGVKADEAPMRRLLFNAVVMGAAYDPSNAIPEDQRRDLVRLASEGLRSAASEITAVQGRLGVAEARIATVKARNTAAEASLSLSYNEHAAADPFETTLTLTELEGQIETAFATAARLSNLTLSRYL